MKNVKVIGIAWYADDLEEIKHLPTEMILDVPSHVEDNDDLEKFIEDELSNQTGFTHTGWESHELFEANPSIEQWESKYKPIINPNAEDECSADRFETYGEDLDFVVNVANTAPKRVWTLEDIDGQLIICAGYHLVNRINYFITEVEWEDKDTQVQYCDEDKLCFSTIEEGLVKIKEAYRNGDVVEGEFADYLVDNYNDFDASVDPLIAIQAIQKFRQWDYETEGEDAVECFDGTEALSEKGIYGFIFGNDEKSKQLPDGIRVAILKRDGAIELDYGITASFSKVQYVNVSGYYTEDGEEFDNLAAIGVWDKISNDDHIFFWFSSEDEILGTHDDFVIMSYLKNGDGEEKRVSATPRFCIVENTEEEGSSTLEDYDTLEKAMGAYNYIKENGFHRVENGNGTDDDIVTLEKGTEISMDIEWWENDTNFLIKNEGIDVPVITIQ